MSGGILWRVFTGAVRAGGVPYGIRTGQRVLLPLRCASRLALPVAASQSKQIGARRRRARGGFRRGYSRRGRPRSAGMWPWS